MNRRGFLTSLLALGLPRPAFAAGGAAPRVVVVGGGFAGATLARYLKLWGGNIDVTLVEQNRVYYAPPRINQALVGIFPVADLRFGYEGLAKRGIRVIHDRATAIDAEKKQLRLAGGEAISYDRLAVAPGIGFQTDKIEGLDVATLPPAYRADDSFVKLGRALADMKDGGVFLLGVPLAPYRCPPGPYERACLIADYLMKHKPKSKLLVLDANPEIASLHTVFGDWFRGRYASVIDYMPSSGVTSVHPAEGVVGTEFDQYKADVVNIIPAQKAGGLAESSGLMNVNGRWCGVDFHSYESTALPNVHVVGDSVAVTLPKSGHMANSEAKICAAAMLALLAGEPVDPDPRFVNTCYFFVSPKEVVHTASISYYDRDHHSMAVVEGTEGASIAASTAETAYAEGWFHNIMRDTLG